MYLSGRIQIQNVPTVLVEDTSTTTTDIPKPTVTNTATNQIQRVNSHHFDKLPRRSPQARNRRASVIYGKHITHETSHQRKYSGTPHPPHPPTPPSLN